jgi:hypothetical protein
LDDLDNEIERHRRMITKEAARLAGLQGRLKVLEDLRASRRVSDAEISKFFADPVTSFLRYLMPVPLLLHLMSEDDSALFPHCQTYTVLKHDLIFSS